MPRSARSSLSGPALRSFPFSAGAGDIGRGGDGGGSDTGPELSSSGAIAVNI